MCVEKQKLVHVSDAMRERFEDECLLSVPSRADNPELEEESTAVFSSLIQKPLVPEPESHQSADLFS